MSVSRHINPGNAERTIRYVIPGVVRERVVWHVLVDLILHAAQHRSEAAALLSVLRQFPGKTPADIVGLEF